METTITRINIPMRAQPAVRMTGRGMHKSKYAQRYLRYKRDVGWLAKSQYKSDPIEGNIAVSIKFFMKGNALPDIDNTFKAITDSLNKIVYKDDRQIKWMQAEIIKCKEEEERSEVEIWKL